MKIAIAGAGMTGAYLYRLLVNQGARVDLFDRSPGTRCGIAPCAWGTSRGFAELVRAAGLVPEDYVLQSIDHVIMDGHRLPADLMTFDKPRLIRDLLRDAEVKSSPLDKALYDRVIDATGAGRAFLPPVREDVVLTCAQYKVQADESLANQIKLGRIGYTWCFPLGNGEYHIGCGTLRSDPRRIIEQLGWVKNTKKILCSCRGQVRITAPHYSTPLVVDHANPEVWGVGEAIGCVAPLAGDGIVPGMKSVQILMDCWNDPSRYTETIFEEFNWMRHERAVIDKIAERRALGVRDAWILKKNSRRMGMQVGLKVARLLLEHTKQD